MISVELNGVHKDFEDFEEFVIWVIDNDLEYLDMDCVETIDDTQAAFEADLACIVLPVDERSDLTISFTYKA